MNETGTLVKTKVLSNMLNAPTLVQGFYAIRFAC